MLFPNYHDYTEAFQEHDFVPVVLEKNADLETAISIFLKVEGNFLLESVEKGDSLGRYSFITLGKKEEIEIRDNLITVTNHQKKTVAKITEEKNPFHYLKKKIVQERVKEFENLPPFLGGYLGYLGYEMIHFFEPKVPIHERSSQDIPDGILVMPEIVLAYDNVKKLINIIYLAHKSEMDASSYQGIAEKIKKAAAKIDQKLSYQPKEPNLAELNEENFHFFSPASYQAKVKQAVKLIREGEIIQVVLSDKFNIKTSLDPFEVYRTLKSLNPSPYLFFLKFSDFVLMGSSPEVMVKVYQDKMLLRPLAGTRPRGKTIVEDLKLKKELLQDEKEIAEHIMLVDLGRNDLSKVAKTNSVKVEDYMQVDQYSQVQHIVSTVKAVKSAGKDNWDVLRATFPAGTLSGAPKVRAMEIIRDLEGKRRNFYGGTVFTFSLNGNLDSCITIRSMLFKDNQATIQAGAGIVLDSDPEKEYLECYNKAGALLAALKKTYWRIRDDISSR